MTTEQNLSYFNPEQYKNVQIDIVHRNSLNRVIQGKGSDYVTIKDAERIQKHIQSLIETGMDIRFIDNELLFVPPEADIPIIVGGAFDKQCIADYLTSAQEQGYNPTVDPILSLRLD
ncbi:MAG TPA: hypothetical protein PLS49_07315 [Candidatus Woesebacteria bacterium]|nr:hypothetical protein [Candidatus Woesebacteria bacterium]